MSKYQKLIFILTMLLCAGILGFRVNRALNLYDEGVSVVGASLVKQGQTPYKDFWTIYPPGHYYVLASLFSIFGDSLLIERFLSAGSRILLLICIFLILKETTRSSIALFIFFLVSLRIVLLPFTGSGIPLSFGLACLSLWLVFKNLDPLKPKIFVFAGILIGLSSLLRYDIGGAALVAVFIPFFMKRKTWNLAFHLALGFAIIILPLSIFFLFQVPFRDIWEDFFLFPFTIYRQTRDLQFPELANPFLFFSDQNSRNGWLQNFIFYFPIIIFFGSIVWFARNRTRMPQRDWFVIMIFLILQMTLLNQILIRGDFSHLLSSAALAFLVFGFLFDRMQKNPISRRIIFILSIPTFAFLIFLRPIQVFSQQIQHAAEGGGGRTLNSARAKGIIVNDNVSPLNTIIDRIQNYASPREKIFVGNSRNSHPTTNDVLLYFLSERNPATKYYELHPGFTTQIEIQERIIHDLQKNDPPVVVLADDQSRGLPKITKASCLTLLDQYIAYRYEVSDNIGPYFFMTKKQGVSRPFTPKKGCKKKTLLKKEYDMVDSGHGERRSLFHNQNV